MERSVKTRKLHLPNYMHIVPLEYIQKLDDIGDEKRREKEGLQKMWAHALQVTLCGNDDMIAFTPDDESDTIYRLRPVKDMNGEANIFIGVASIFDSEVTMADGTVDTCAIRSIPGAQCLTTGSIRVITGLTSPDAQWQEYHNELVVKREVYTDEEFDMFKDLFQRCVRYQHQVGPEKNSKFLHYEDVIDEHEHKLLVRHLRCTPHHSMIRPLLDIYMKQYDAMRLTYTDPVVLAAFVHNAFMWVNPKWGFNGHCARLMGNMHLMPHMYPPFPAEGHFNEEYDRAVKEDMRQIIPRKKGEAPDIIFDSVLEFLYRLKRANPCYFCGKHDEEERKNKRCARCHLVRYCSRDCQLANWPAHKLFCNDNKKE